MIEQKLIIYGNNNTLFFKILYFKELESFSTYPLEVLPNVLYIGTVQHAGDRKLHRQMNIVAHINCALDNDDPMWVCEWRTDLIIFHCCSNLTKFATLNQSKLCYMKKLKVGWFFSVPVYSPIVMLVQLLPFLFWYVCGFLIQQALVFLYLLQIEHLIKASANFIQ